MQTEEKIEIEKGSGNIFKDLEVPTQRNILRKPASP